MDKIKLELDKYIGYKLSKHKIWRLNLTNLPLYKRNALKHLNNNINNDRRLSYSLDNRNKEEMLANIIVGGWLVEDTLVKKFKNQGLKVGLNGNDADRDFNNNYSANADLIVEGKTLEVQQTMILHKVKIKFNKLNNCLINNSNILLINLKNNNEYKLLEKEFLEQIEYNNELKEIYKGKKGFEVNLNEVESLNFEELIKRIKNG